MGVTADRLVGRLVADRYRVLALVGAGGMGEVYRAEHVVLHRATALKLMRPALDGDPDALARFRREAEQASRIAHPNVAAIYDFGDAGDGLVFLAMEFVEGETLAERLARQGRLTPGAVARVVGQAAAGLAAAHRRGVLHRDLKPANIMLAAEGVPESTTGGALGAEARGGTPDGAPVVKLVDFGIARSILGEVSPADAGGASPPPPLTRTGMVLGTPAYASPEQLAGEALDARSDLYALALVAFEALTGAPAFAAASPRDLIVRRLTARPRAVTAVLSPAEAPWAAAVQPVLDRALDPEPAARYDDVARFAADLGAALGASDASGASTAPAVDRDAAPATASGTTGRAPGRRRAARRRWRPSLVAAALVILALGGAGALVWRRSPGASPAPLPDPGAEVRRVAVLPFDNVGRPEDAYVADGLTDEIRAKLASVPGLAVIARASSNQYRQTQKSPRAIADELGVRYLLTGTVRSEPGAAGRPARVRVTPELVEVTAGSAPVGRWQQALDADAADVFAMEADIAGRVAGALDVALGGGTRAQLAEVPTQNPAAYDAYLRGEAAADGLSAEPVALRRALGYYAQATALDSGFADAWVQRARVAAALYFRSAPTPALAQEARAAAARALALAPDRAGGYIALGDYYLSVAKDYARALAAYTDARRRAPGDAQVLSAVARVEGDLGRVADQVPDYQAAAARDPRAVDLARRLSFALLYSRRYPEARAAADRALALAPANPAVIENRAMVDLAQGDLAGARRVLAATPPGLDRDALAATTGNFWDLVWVLDDADQRRLLALGPASFDDDRAAWATVLAQTYALRGDAARARAYADSAHRAFQEQLRVTPDDAQRWVIDGLVLAYMGRGADAVAAAERGAALLPLGRAAYSGAYIQHQLARVYLLTGRPEQALDALEPLLHVPYYLSPGWLRIDPTFAPLRGNARFARLAAGK